MVKTFQSPSVPHAHIGGDVHGHHEPCPAVGGAKGLKLSLTVLMHSECCLAWVLRAWVGPACLSWAPLLLETHRQALVGTSTACWNINTEAVRLPKMATPRRPQTHLQLLRGHIQGGPREHRDHPDVRFLV